MERLVLEGTPMEPNELIEFDWHERRARLDVQLEHVVKSIRGHHAERPVERAVDAPKGLVSKIGRYSTATRAGRTSSINRMPECSAGASEIMQQTTIPLGDIGVFWE